LANEKPKSADGFATFAMSGSCPEHSINVAEAGIRKPASTGDFMKKIVLALALEHVTLPLRPVDTFPRLAVRHPPQVASAMLTGEREDCGGVGKRNTPHKQCAAGVVATVIGHRVTAAKTLVTRNRPMDRRCTTTSPPHPALIGRELLETMLPIHTVAVR
jgi:hypothetical protein